MSYRPPIPTRPLLNSHSRSHSRSPEYRQRRYSPSRPLSPPPPALPSRPIASGQRYDERRPIRQDRWSPPPPQRRPIIEESYAPPPRRYDDPPAPRRYDDAPAPRRYDYDDPPPPSRRYDEPPRRDHVRPRHEYEYDDDRDRYPAVTSMRDNERSYRREDDRGRDWERRYEYDAPPPPGMGMAADREDLRSIPPPRRERGEQWERGRDVEELESYSNAHSPAPAAQDYSTANRDRRQKGRNDPSTDVIFLGLDPELSETDFAAYLKLEHMAEIESVKIVKDKVTGTSKGFGFASFTSIDASTEFINNNFPSILMPALYAHSESRKVKVNFSATQASSSATYDHSRAYIAAPAHDGMRDIGSPGEGKRVLLLRGLDPHTPAKEVVKRISQEIARMAGRVEKEIMAESTIVRFALIVDRSARSSWGYGFLELATAELAAALLPFLLTPQYQPNGFVIDYRPVAASFANPAAFVPAPAGPLGGEFLLHASQNGGIGSDTIDGPEGKWVAYWHASGGSVETIPNGAPIISDDGKFDLTSVQSTFLGPLAGPSPQAVAEQVGASGAQSGASAPLVMGGLQPIKIGIAPVKGKKKEEHAIIPLSTKNMLDDGEDVDLVGRDTVLLSRTKGVHIIPPTSSSRKIAKNISKWNTKQSELAAPEPVDPNGPPKGISDVNTTLGVRRPAPAPAPALEQIANSISVGTDQLPKIASPVGAGPSASASSSKSPSGNTDEYDYTDISTLPTTGKVACLLCQRQFKSEEILKKHVGQSDLHKTNLLDDTIREAGQRRKAAVLASTEGTKYRDRAAERRVAFNQPNAPVPEGAPVSSQSNKRKFAEGPAPPPPPPPAPEKGLEPGKDESNVGNLLLAKMGWKAGTGLGLEGQGRVDPVLVQQFESRAGLGASKGVEAGKYSGQGGYQQKKLDMAKQRYHQDGQSGGGGSGST